MVPSQVLNAGAWGLRRGGALCDEARIMGCVCGDMGRVEKEHGVRGAGTRFRY